MQDEQPRLPQSPFSGKRPLWMRVFWWLTGIWIVVIMSISRGNPEHPLMSWVFLAPLGVWLTAVVVVSSLQVWKKRTGSGESDSEG